MKEHGPITWYDLDLGRVIDEMRDAIIIVDQNSGEVALWNAAATAMFGYHPSEALRLPVTSLMPSDGHTQHTSAVSHDRDPWFEEAPNAIVRRPLEMPAMRKTGEEIYVELNLSQVPGAGQEGQYVLAVIRDVTERRRAADLLKESEERFKAFMDHSPAIAFIKDTEGRYSYINKAFERIFDIKQLSWEGRTLFDLVEPDVARRMSENSARALSLNAVVEVEEVVPMDGTLQYWLVYRFPIMGREGQRQVAGIGIEVTERRRAQEALNQANEKLKARIQELEQHSREMTLLCEMGEMLQSCRSVEEAYAVVSNSAPEVFPGCSGSLLVRDGVDGMMETAASWGNRDPTPTAFDVHDCWALRRGRVHVVRYQQPDLVCPHLVGILQGTCVCVPLITQGQTLGLLSLDDAAGASLAESHQRLAQTVGEQISMALANLRLQETLRSQSIRDPLTGLFNRRYMEASLDRELRRAERNQIPVGVIMIDIDNFKRFNDTSGHAAGDTLLRTLGGFLRDRVRADDIACRYGGDEFTLILPEATLEDTLRRAEQLRDGVKRLNVQHRRQPLGELTLSLGGAIFPDHGTSGEAILRAADLALYRAKRAGRDRVELA